MGIPSLAACTGPTAKACRPKPKTAPRRIHLPGSDEFSQLANRRTASSCWKERHQTWEMQSQGPTAQAGTCRPGCPPRSHLRIACTCGQGKVLAEWGNRGLDRGGRGGCILPTRQAPTHNRTGGGTVHNPSSRQGLLQLEHAERHLRALTLLAGDKCLGCGFKGGRGRRGGHRVGIVCLLAGLHKCQQSVGPDDQKTSAPSL